MNKVALVFPYFRTRSPTEMLFPPLGVAALAGQLRRLGVETRIFDGTFSTLEGLSADLVSYAPDIVGISSMVSLTRNTFRLAEMVGTELPHTLLAAGGPLPSVFPRRYAEHFDVVFRGEADVSFPRFCLDYLEQGASPATLGQLPLGRYHGLFVSNHGLRVDNPTVHHGERELAAFALPDRSDFDHGAYQKAAAACPADEARCPARAA
jgi:anaerobic magnesium-protoporphyrin IX monomethyl ester cyclase